MKRRSFRQYQFVMLFGLTLVVLTISVSVNLYSSRNTIIQSATAQLETVADLKSAQIHEWLNQGREIVRLISALYEEHQEISALLTSSDDEAFTMARIHLKRELASIKTIFPNVRSVSLLHPTGGQVLLSTDPGQKGRKRRNENYFSEGQQALYVSPVSYSMGREAPVLIISAPVRDKNDHVLTVIAAEMNLTELAATFSSRVGLGQTGRSYLVEAYGFYVTLAPDEDTGPLRAIAKSEGVRRALDGQNGSDMYLDPRGVRVLGVYRWLPEGHPGQVGEIEVTELTA